MALVTGNVDIATLSHIFEAEQVVTMNDDDINVNGNICFCSQNLMKFNSYNKYLKS